MKEIYKLIGWENAGYEVSNLGNIKNRYGKIMKGVIDRGGYHTIRFNKHLASKTFSIHRLVAIAFIDNPENKGEVNHLNNIMNDNKLSNLEWTTRSENQKHKYKMGYIHPNTGKFGDKHYSYGKTGKYWSFSKKVKQLDLDGNLIKVWDCIMDIERTLGLQNPNITKVCKGFRNTTGGFKFEYVI